MYKINNLNDAIAINTEARKTIIELSRKYGLSKYAGLGMAFPVGKINNEIDLKRWKTAQHDIKRSSKAMTSLLKDMEVGR